MAEGNGVARPRKTVDFVIGGETIAVPILMLGDVEALAVPIRALGPEQWWVDYSKCVLEVVAYQTKRDFNELKNSCSIAEARDLSSAMNKLLDESGFIAPSGEVEAASPGTGTSSDSPPNSPPEASAPETSTQ